MSRTYSSQIPRRIASATLLTLVAFAAPALATEVSGELALGDYHPQAQEPKVPTYRWELENGVKEVLPDRVAARELAVVLTGGVPPVMSKEVVVPISGGELLPSTVVLRTASSLVLKNTDDISHEVYAVGLADFAAEPVDPGAKRIVNFGKPGHWALLDNTTPHARGHVHVLDDLVAVATLTDDGKFVFANVPAGKYVLHVFHGAQEVDSQPVEVGEQALTLNAIALKSKK